MTIIVTKERNAFVARFYKNKNSKPSHTHVIEIIYDLPKQLQIICRTYDNLNDWENAKIEDLTD